MPVTLVAMPWQAVDMPSLPLGILRTVAADAGLPVPTTYPAALRWVEFLMEQSAGEILPQDYSDIAESGFFDALGDWVFTGVLHDDAGFGVAQLDAYAEASDLDLGGVRRMRAFAADFIELAVAEILATGPTVVGFSTTFMQNVPSLAAARRLKQLAPHVTVVFGGGNCDGPMGAALHRAFPFVDLVISGEAEIAFPALLRALDGDGELSGVPALCWRTSDGTQRCNPKGPAVPASRFVTPDFGDYFERLAESPAIGYLEPMLVMETSRGCWWGEKHHCTFCGLNGSTMAFRALDPDAAIDQLALLVGRHRVLDVVLVDNIIDNRYFTSLLPRLAAMDWDVRLFYEVKANLRPADIEALRAAGVAQIQPGVESLVSSVLGLMDKGVSGVQNVRTLRDATAAGLTVSWNWLYGFPGETPAAYQPVIEQLPALIHLPAPQAVTRISLERFSPHFDNPALGFAEKKPSRVYDHVYRLPDEVLRDLAYVFEAPARGLDGDQSRELREVVERWRDHHAGSTLHRVDDGETVTVIDRRHGRPEKEHRFGGPLWRIAYLELEHGRTPDALARRIAERGVACDRHRLDDWLAGLREHDLVFVESGRWITLATSTEPIELAVR